MLGDAATGRVTTVMTEKDEAWVDVGDYFRWLDGGRRFLWVSERDGWRHVYSVPVGPGFPADTRLLTPDPSDVIEVEHVDEKGGWLYFSASPDNATQRFLFRTRLDGSGKAERLTPAGERGTHRYQISPDARWAIHVASAFGRPPVTDLVRAARAPAGARPRGQRGPAREGRGARPRRRPSSSAWTSAAAAPSTAG